MVVDLSHGSRKQLRKKASRKRKVARVQSERSEPSVSTSKRARVTVEDIPDEQAGGLSASSSMISIGSLVRKVSNIDHLLCLMRI
jgi:hypothetical protein